MQRFNGLLKATGCWIVTSLILGCASIPSLTVPKQVYVPVPVYCTSKAPENTTLPVSMVTAATSDASVARAYVGTVKILKTQNIQLMNSLKACEKPNSFNSPGSSGPGK